VTLQSYKVRNVVIAVYVKLYPQNFLEKLRKQQNKSTEFHPMDFFTSATCSGVSMAKRPYIDVLERDRKNSGCRL
jgi:hypothetical protein